MTHTLHITATNVGPISGELELHLSPGLNILEGRNGAGKSTIIEAIVHASTGGHLSKETGHRDDTTGLYGEARIEEGDALLASTSRKRDKRHDPSVPLAPWESVGVLLDGGGLKDPEKRDARRIRSLFELLPSLGEVQPGDAAALLPEGVSGDLPGSLLDAGDAARKLIHAQRRAAESDRDAQKGILASKRNDLALLGDVSTDPQDLEIDLATLEKQGTAAQRAATVTRERHDRRVDLETARDSQSPRPTTDGIDAEIDKAAADVARHTALEQECRAVVALLEGQLAAAKNELAAKTQARASHEREHERLQTRRNEIETQAIRWDEAQKSYQGIAALPTLEQVQAAEQQVLDHRETYRRCSKAQQAEQIRAAIKEAKTKRDRHDKEARDLQAAADAIPSTVASIMAKRGLPEGLRIADGRLYCEQGGKWMPYDDDKLPSLSSGQRVAVALKLALAAYPGRIVPMADDWLARLDSDAVQAIAEEAERQGVILLSERATTGDLKLVRVGGEK